MPDISWDHAAEARAALNAIVTDPEHGVAALSNPQTMSNLLKDLLPDAPREKSILVAAAEAGLADALRERVAQGMDSSTAISLTASSFSTSTPFTPEACNWVTSEIAVALGIGQGGVGAQAGPGQVDQHGMATQIRPIPGFGQAAKPPADSPQGQGLPTQVAPQSFPQGPGQVQSGGFGASPAGAQSGYSPSGQPSPAGAQPGYSPSGQPNPASGQPGYSPSGQPSPAGYSPSGQPAGYAAGPAGGQPGYSPSGQPSPAGYNPSGQPAGYASPGPAGGPPTIGGQPTIGGYSPGGQPAGYSPGSPGGGYAVGPGGQATVGGYGPGGQVGGYVPGGTPGGFGPGGPGGPGFGPPPKSGAKRGLLIGGGILAVIIVIIVIAASLSSKGTPSASGSGSSGNSQSPSPSPSPTPTPQPTSGVESLNTIMNPSGLPPVGTRCEQAPPSGLNVATLVGRLYCPDTSINFVPTKHIVVWAYQFDNYNDYVAGFAKLNQGTGFKSAGAVQNCPTPTTGQYGKTTWWADHNPKYNKSHDHGQYLECFTQYTTHHRYQPFLLWTMPSQHVVFLSRDEATGATLKQLVNWWKHVSYS